MKDQKQSLEEEGAGKRPSVGQKNSARYGAAVIGAETDLGTRARYIADGGEVLSNSLHQAGPSDPFTNLLVSTIYRSI
jgi:hypothetical protein